VKETGDVYYFGDDVNNYKDGKVINHESAWHAGEKGARFGLMIPGKPPGHLNIASTSRKPPRWKPMSATSTTRQASA
jgi:hypothetical protein